MPIKQAAEPSDAFALMQKHLPDIVQGTPDHMHGDASTPIEHMHVSEAYPGYQLGLDDLVVDAPLLENAHRRTWNYIVFSLEPPKGADPEDPESIPDIPDPQVIGIAHLLEHPDGEVSFHGMSSGPLMHAKLDAIDSVQLDPRVQGEAGPDYELRMLSIPAVHYVGLWLHGAAMDWFVPVVDDPSWRTHDEGGLDPKQFYTWEQLTTRLRESALETHARGNPTR